MNPALLLQHFDRISEAPYAIPHLRQFILALVVRGKLVEQDPSDEPASELLKRMEVEKTRLVKIGEVRKSRPLPDIGDSDLLFDLPSGWSWARLDALS